MKAHKFIFFFTLLFATVCTYAQEITPSDTPNETQKAMLKRGYGMFIHFGVNTFSGDEWSDGTVPVSAYNPTRLDCDQWVRVARDAGFRYVLLITKHHDWPNLSGKRPSCWSNRKSRQHQRHHSRS